jgi:peptidylprolyl isomerase
MSIKNTLIPVLLVATTAGLIYWYVLEYSKDHTITKGFCMNTQNSKVESPTGLVYEILHNAPENAAQPSVGKKVTVHYTGWLDEKGQPGKKFDSSVDRNQPFQFTIGVGQVIQGWDEGVLTMRVGEKRRLTIPAHIGYGARGAGAIIPPNATLIFDVELLGVE